MNVVAPGDVVSVLDAHEARVVAVAERLRLARLVLPGDHRVVDLEGLAVAAAAEVQVGATVLVVGAKDADEGPVVRQDRAVEDARGEGVGFQPIIGLPL